MAFPRIREEYEGQESDENVNLVLRTCLSSLIDSPNLGQRGKMKLIPAALFIFGEKTMRVHEKFLRVQDVSRIFDVNEDTVRRWAREQKIPCVRVGARVLRFREVDIAALLKVGLRCEHEKVNTGK